MATLGDKNQQNSAHKFSCISCDYNTSRKSNYETHLLSGKHKRVTNRLQMGLKSVKKQQEQAETFNCSCGKQYQHRQSLWKHKKTCSIISCKEDLNDSAKQQQLIEYLLKENSEFKQLIIDQNKHMIELAKNFGSYNK